MVVAAPTGYWRKWIPNSVTGEWWYEYARLLDGLGTALDTPLSAIDFGTVGYIVDTDGLPRLTGHLESNAVHYWAG